jgi:hypothetical protein
MASATRLSAVSQPQQCKAQLRGFGKPQLSSEFASDGTALGRTTFASCPSLCCKARSPSRTCRRPECKPWKQQRHCASRANASHGNCSPLGTYPCASMSASQSTSGWWGIGRTIRAATPAHQYDSFEGAGHLLIMLISTVRLDRLVVLISMATINFDLVFCSTRSLTILPQVFRRQVRKFH